jgi:hypothetical protein
MSLQQCGPILLVLAVALMSAGCGAPGVSGPVGPPDDNDPAILLRPVGAGTLRPGAVVELVYQVDALHGLEHTLEQWDGADWSAFRYGVASDREEFAVQQGTPWSESRSDVDAVDIGFEGPGGGLFLTLPDDAQGQVVRVCATDTRLCSVAHDFR